MRTYHKDIENPSWIPTKVDDGFNPMYVIGKRVSSAITYFEKYQISYTFKDMPIGMGSTSLVPGTHIYDIYKYNIQNKADWIIVAFHGVA